MKGDLNKACNLLKQGQIVAIPTETVYGLACDPNNPAAIEKLFALKKRPHNCPFAVLISTTDEVLHWARVFPKSAQKLADAFWPGPLTLVLPKQDHVCDHITASKNTIGLRMPDHPMALSLLNTFGGGLPTSSANLSKNPSATTIQEVEKIFGAQVSYYLDGGPARLGLASSVIAIENENDPPKILRSGALDIVKLNQVISCWQ